MVFFLFALPLELSAQERTNTTPETQGNFEIIQKERGGFFPGIYFTDVIEAAISRENSSPFWVRTYAEQEAYNRMVTDYMSIILNNDILAYYGHPRSRQMGILGRFPMDELHRQLKVTAARYEAVNGGRPVKIAFYIIFGTAWPEGEIGVINQDLLRTWVEYALENDILVFLDHQIGRHDPIASLSRMFSWLRYPNVHLALDPEWRTRRPMLEIGHLTAEEINRAQQVMENYMYDNDITGERILIIHQFNWRMIINRDDVISNFRRVRLVHHISGIGTPTEKIGTYAHHGARAMNIPVKGFKLWYDFNIPGHRDHPLMSPADVMELVPRPYIIMYQ